VDIGRRDRLAGLRQERQDARRLWSDRDKAVRHPGRQRDGAVGADDAAFVADPHLQRALEHDDDLVGGVVEMRRRARARLDDAEARRTGDALLRAGEREAAIARAPRDFGGALILDNCHRTLLAGKNRRPQNSRQATRRCAAGPFFTMLRTWRTHPTTTSLSAPARPAARWPTG